MWGYLAISFGFLAFGKRVAEGSGIRGISIFYTISVTVLALIFLVYIIVIEKVEKKRRSNS